MRGIVIKTFIFLFLGCLNIKALPDQEKFLQAVQMYNNADVYKAKEAFEAIGKKNRTVFYNLGNCHYHLNDYPQAILHWAKAQKGACFNEYLNLESLIKKAQGKLKIITSNGHSIKTYIFALFSKWSILFIQFLMLLVWVLLLLNIFVFRYRYKLAGSLFLMLLFFLISTGYFYRLNGRNVVVVSKTILLAGPAEDYHSIKKISEGTSFELLEKKEIWYKVKIQNLTGWLNSQFAELI